MESTVHRSLGAAPIPADASTPEWTVFNSAPNPVSNIFNPATQTWQLNVAATNYGGDRTYGSSVLLPLTPANNYKPRVFILGGGESGDKHNRSHRSLCEQSPMGMGSPYDSAAH